ncbi:MAG: SEL1-like repeat protein [Alphaproteobacteria bacterium]|jgi:TPR repeat protein|nr:SEL1-like repeat protein [Alphaproteobacteria bacterium]MBP9877998.1 SEL1-like repeat protein [Alphaproteobacteria bacterium]
MSSVENQSYSDSEVYSPTQTTSSSDTSFSDGTDLLMNRRTSSSELIETDSISLSSRESSFLDEDNPKADLQELISLLKKAAFAGESMASLRLGQIYQNMDGADRSDIYALFWFQHAMRINPELRYEYRDVCTKIRRQIADRMCNGIDSFQSYLDLAKQKIPIGRYLVGLSYEMGLFEGVQVNSKKAFSCYKKLGHALKEADLFFDLGRRYLKGIGCKQSVRKAISCFKEAENLKHESARVELGLIYYQKGNYTRAIGYLGTEVDKEDSRVPFTIAEMYYAGLGFPKDYGKAMVYYENAAHADHVESQVILGRMYAGEFGAKEDFTRAFFWFTKAAEQFDIVAQYKLAVLFYNGQGVKQSFSEAFRLLFSLAKQINVVGKKDLAAIDFEIKSSVEFVLGRMYFEGKGVRQSQDEGIKWLAQASAKGNRSAQSYARKKGMA